MLPLFTIPIQTETPVKKGRGRGAKKAEEEVPAVAEEVKEKKPAARRGKKSAPAAEVEQVPEEPKSSPVKARGRAAAKKASDATKAAIDDMSNLNKKKRRPR